MKTYKQENNCTGLSVEPASKVNAPRITECFLALECRLLWEKEIFEGKSHDYLAVLQKLRDMGEY